MNADVKKAFLDAFRHTLDMWEEHGYCQSGGNHVESVEYLGRDEKGHTRFTIKVWHEDGGPDGSLCHRTYENLSGAEAIDIFGKYVTGDIGNGVIWDTIEKLEEEEK